MLRAPRPLPQSPAPDAPSSAAHARVLPRVCAARLFSPRKTFPQALFGSRSAGQRRSSTRFLSQLSTSRWICKILVQVKPRFTAGVTGLLLKWWRVISEQRTLGDHDVGISVILESGLKDVGEGFYQTEKALARQATPDPSTHLSYPVVHVLYLRRFWCLSVEG